MGRHARKPRPRAELLSIFSAWEDKHYARGGSVYNKRHFGQRSRERYGIDASYRSRYRTPWYMRLFH